MKTDSKQQAQIAFPGLTQKNTSAETKALEHTKQVFSQYEQSAEENKVKVADNDQKTNEKVFKKQPRLRNQGLVESYEVPGNLRGSEKMTDTKEFYKGYSCKNANHCSFSGFLEFYQEIIINSPPDTDDWAGLEATWKRRFLRAVKEIFPDGYGDDIYVKVRYLLENFLSISKRGLLVDRCLDQGYSVDVPAQVIVVQSEASNSSYWQKIINEKKQVSIMNNHIYGSLSILDVSAKYNTEIIASKILKRQGQEQTLQNDPGETEEYEFEEIGKGYKTPQDKIDDDCILRAAAESLVNLDDANDSKYFKEFIPLFYKYKETQDKDPYSYANDDVMDIRGDSGFSKFLSLDQYIKLMSVKPRRKAVLPKCWQQILDDYFSQPKIFILIKDGDSNEATQFKNYLYKPLPDISALRTSEHHYWSEFGHRFFSKALQDFVNLDWRILEVPVYAFKYRKNYGINHIFQKVVDGKSADILAWTWDSGEEVFVGEQAGPPTVQDLTKYAFDSFKLYRELRDCLNVRIL
ncbi:16728_t:CDS:10 [Funneliformis caledonium]|uniref:16728_t:CDS:1 n=1 Tax=Funneliformis caledonium TaxID=1117310 RepID=A0A9N9DRP5_9GLOM|nr:16728_t:CDS:10 [Funneliformis caledonium]